MNQHLDSATRVRTLLWAALSSPRATLFVIAAGVLLTASSLTNGLNMDDHFQRSMAGGYAAVQRAPTDLFRFVSGDPAEHRILMERGAFPWFTSKQVKLAFFRPLSSLSVYADYALLPFVPWLFHLESLALFAALIALVLALYRSILPSLPIAALAGLMFAVDEAHAFPVGWLANRNALFAAVFGVGAVLLHDRATKQGSLPARLLAPGLLALAFLSGEVGASAFVYILAYAFALDPAPLRRRLLSVVPYWGVGIGWWLTIRAIDFGVRGSAYYVDPADAPLRFLATFPSRWLVMFVSQFALPSADLWIVWSNLKWPLQVGVAMLGLGVLGAIGVVLAPLLRRDRGARFLALGTVGSLILSTTVIPSDRNLLFSGVGAFGLIALLLGNLVTGEGGVGPRWMRRALIGIHLVFAPLLLPVASMTTGITDRVIRKGLAAFEHDPTVANQTVVLVNMPNVILQAFYWTTPNEPGDPVPARLRSPSMSDSVELLREDDRTLRITMLPPSLVADPTLLIVRAPTEPFQLGDRVVLPPVTYSVTRINEDGSLLEVRCEFDVPLEDPSLRWVAWNGASFVEYRPPQVGGRARVAP